MDYGDSTYQGVVMFNPLRRDQMCQGLNRIADGRCGAFEPSADAGGCGNGVLEEGEQCECLEYGLQECGKCKQCCLKNFKENMCESRLFVRRQPGMGKFVAVSSALLDNSECCSKGKLLGPTKG